MARSRKAQSRIVAATVEEASRVMQTPLDTSEPPAPPPVDGTSTPTPSVPVTTPVEPKRKKAARTEGMHYRIEGIDAGGKIVIVTRQLTIGRVRKLAIAFEHMLKSQFASFGLVKVTPVTLK